MVHLPKTPSVSASISFRKTNRFSYVALKLIWKAKTNNCPENVGARDSLSPLRAHAQGSLAHTLATSTALLLPFPSPSHLRWAGGRGRKILALGNRPSHRSHALHRCRRALRHSRPRPDPVGHGPGTAQSEPALYCRGRMKGQQEQRNQTTRSPQAATARLLQAPLVLTTAFLWERTHAGGRGAGPFPVHL